jgi:ubiquinone/menaquinone biosynthesis C-methylase UbiE
MNSTLKVWSRQSEKWSNVGPPMRPSLLDIALMEKLAIDILNDVNLNRYEVAVLGVTPEIIQMAWPLNAHLTAFDQSEEMIKKLWRPNQHIKSDVKMSRWQSLPLKDGDINLVIGDGCLTPLTSLEVYSDVLKELKRVLVTEGKVIMRCFVRDPKVQDIENIVQCVQLKKIENFGSLKWKIAMALVDPISSKVEIKKISETFNDLFKDRQALANNNKWPIETINTIDIYESMSGYLTFPTLNRLLEIFEEFFVVEQVTTLDYEMAKNCPTIVLKQK